MTYVYTSIEQTKHSTILFSLLLIKLIALHYDIGKNQAQHAFGIFRMYMDRVFRGHFDNKFTSIHNNVL